MKEKSLPSKLHKKHTAISNADILKARVSPADTPSNYSNTLDFHHYLILRVHIPHQKTIY